MTYGPQQPGHWQSPPPGYPSQPPPGYQAQPPGYGQFGPPPPKSKTWVWLCVGFGVVFLVLAGCGGAVYFGLNVSATDMALFFEDDPQIRAHIGEIQSCSIAFWATMTHPDDSIFIYDVEGTKGEGRLIVEETDSLTETEIVSAVLELPNGQKIRLMDDPNGPLDNLFD